MESQSTARRRHPDELKAQVLAACAEPGASIAAVAQAHGLNANLVHKWRRGRGVGASCEPRRRPAPQIAHQFVALAPPPPGVHGATAPSADIRIELRRGAASAAVSWPLGAAEQCAAWLTQWLR
jgi:transposase